MSNGGELVIRTMAMPRDTNPNGDIFGGWLLSQMDLGGGIAAKKLANSRICTVAIDKMHFIRPVQVGDTVCCYADILKVGRTSIKIKITAWVLPANADVKEKVTEGIFTYVAIDEAGKPQPVQRQ
jgi:acyl-CoA thioesterase YciA